VVSSAFAYVLLKLDCEPVTLVQRLAFADRRLQLDEKTRVMSTIFRIGRFLTSRALCIASGEMALSSVHATSCAPAALVRETAIMQSPITVETATQADKGRTCRIGISQTNRRAAPSLQKYQLRRDLVSEGGFESAELMCQFLD
jgi:hypothetical protein